MIKRAFAIAAVVFAVVFGLAAPASAAGDSTSSPGGFTTMAGPCGSSYSLIGHYPITASGKTVAYMDVYWSSSARRNCMVTNHTGSTYGTSLYTQATIRPSGFAWPSCPNSTGCDGAFYRYYAGPVYTPTGVDMSRRCLDVKGTIDWTSGSRTRIHCG